MCGYRFKDHFLLFLFFDTEILDILNKLHHLTFSPWSSLRKPLFEDAGPMEELRG